MTVSSRGTRSGRPIDSQRSKLYAAEVPVHSEIVDKEIPDLQDCKAAIERMIQCAWFRERWPLIVWVEVADGAGSRHASGRIKDGDTAVIKLPRFARREWIILHELAHVVTPDQYAAHGREYCANYLLLVRHFLGIKAAQALRKSFVAHKVRYKPKMQLSEEQRAALRERFAKIKTPSTPKA